MNKFLCGSALLLSLCVLDSCSLLHSMSGRKKRAGNTMPLTDTTKIVAAPANHNFIALPEQDTISAVPDTTGLMKKLVDMVLPIYNKRISYTTFSCKAKVNFTGPEDKQDFTANIRLKKDTAIWVDITGLGGMVHAARVYITRDSFFMINYLQKTGQKLALKDVGKVLPTQVDFTTLQNLIIGEPLRAGNIRDVAVLGNSWLLRVQDDSYIQMLNYSKADNTLTNSQVNTLAPNGPEAVLQYNSFEDVGGRKMSMSRNVHITNGNDKFLLEMDLQNAEFDKQLDMPFSIPKSFSTK